ncbi:MAG: hypothetical protein DLM61_19405 [Pseudonocardiales bacterium]|nr:MAG: hypothetical protein DLM61_19405 [Pseudonocardiales bacterium]
MAVSEFIAAGRRERRVLIRVSRAAWRLRSAEREREWALGSARLEGVSIRKLASAAGLSASRVHQLLAGVDLDRLGVVLGQLREVGWPAPEDPDAGGDPELDGRDLIAERLDDEAEWLRQAAGWLSQLEAGGYPPVVNLRPSDDWPETANVAVNLERVVAVLERIASDVQELARARRVADLRTAGALSDRRAERRRRLAEPDLDFRTFCRAKRMSASSARQLERAWDAWRAELYRRGEITDHPAYADNPYRGR